MGLATIAADLEEELPASSPWVVVATEVEMVTTSDAVLAVAEGLGIVARAAGTGPVVAFAVASLAAALAEAARQQLAFAAEAEAGATAEPCLPASMVLAAVRPAV